MDDVDRLINLLQAIADSVDKMSDEEVRAELEEEGDSTFCHSALHLPTNG